MPGKRQFTSRARADSLLERTEETRFFRLVCLENEISLVEDFLRAEGYAFSPLEFWTMARRLDLEPEPLGRSLASFFGRIYIQDQSSMIPPLVLAPSCGAVVLDMCASPGSKTGMLSQMVGSHGLVVANEPNQARMVTLQANMRRMGLLNVVCSAYPGEGLPLPDHTWPYILCDVPCSGWGTEDRHPGIRELWTKDKALRLVDLQWKILSRAAGLLAPGGKLVYSTCTTNPMENRMQVERAVRELGLGLEGIPPLEGIIPHADSGHGRLVVDGEASGSQGFFVALLRKPGELEIFEENDPVEIGDTKARLPFILQEFAHCLPQGEAEIQKGRVFFRPARALDVLPSMYHWKGPFLGRIGKNRLVPAPHQRSLLPCGPEKGLELENLDQIRGLISGASMPAPEHASHCPGLYRCGLPLAWLRRKGARIFWGS